MMELYRKTDHQEEKVRLMRNMGGADDQIVIERALKFAMSVRNDLRISWLANVWRSG